MAMIFAWAEARRTGCNWCALTPSRGCGSSTRLALLTPEVRSRSLAHKPRYLAHNRANSSTVSTWHRNQSDRRFANNKQYVCFPPLSIIIGHRSRGLGVECLDLLRVATHAGRRLIYRLFGCATRTTAAIPNRKPQCYQTPMAVPPSSSSRSVRSGRLPVHLAKQPRRPYVPSGRQGERA